jgi:hypothetical protein
MLRADLLTLPTFGRDWPALSFAGKKKGENMKNFITLFFPCKKTKL